MHVDMTPEQTRQLETYGMLHTWLAEPHPRNMKQMLTGDLVQEHEGIQHTLQSLFLSPQIDHEDTGLLVLALTKQMREVEAELHRRLFISKTAPAGFRPLIPREIVQLVKASADIVEVCQRLGLDLHQSGQRWKSLCPFHEDQNPSLVLYPETNTFYCFGCHLGGDVIEIVKLLDKVSFTSAVRRLAYDYGILIPEWNYPQRAAEIARMHSAL